VVKLVALYDEQLEYLCSYPQKMTQLRAKVRSLEYEASRLKYLETEVEKLKSLWRVGEGRLLLRRRLLLVTS
jgi:hypothetical protein